MKVCVFGLGHLGSVTAACLAADGHEVAGADPDGALVAELAAGESRFLEPGLPELLAGVRYTTDTAAALAGAEVLWLADDTPVDEDDIADTAWVLERAAAALAHRPPVAVVSSQLPVGSVARLERDHPDVRFACIPENLRLGRAVETFRRPERVVAGARDERTRSVVAALLATYADRLVWMSVESAELTKHALNAYLATSVAFANEIAGICETTGADAREVEAGLRSDARVGAGAYVSPGPPFSGGTLARDVEYLRALGRTPLLDGVALANEEHRGWTRRQLASAGVQVVAVWGLAYKPGTNSTRRSAAVELCTWLEQRGVVVRTHDPAVGGTAADPVEATSEADALVIAVAWPEYADVPADAVASALRQPLVIDPSGVAAGTLGRAPGIRYVTVGRAA